jgi:hypothetical protein
VSSVICKAKHIDKLTHKRVTVCGGLVKQRLNARQPITVAYHWRLVTCKKCLRRRIG